MPPSPFTWDLAALTTDDAVKKSPTMKVKRTKEMRAVEEGTKADPYVEKAPAWGGSPLGDLLSGRPARDDRKPIVTLAVSWMMALKAGCVQPATRGYGLCNNWSRGLYIAALCASLGVAVATFVEPNYYEPQHLDWFAWTSWATVALSEVLFILYRIAGRCQQIVNPLETGVAEVIASFARRTPFGTAWQAVLVVTVDMTASLLFLLGYLVIHAQMMIDTGNEAMRIVNEDQRERWTLLWTCVYIVVTLGLVWAALVDPSRIGEVLGELKIVDQWSLEFQAWRVVFLGLAMPIIGFAFAIYVNVCCEGPLYYR
jgi:hypothetical protein